MQPKQWLMSYYSTHSQGLMKKANNISSSVKKRVLSLMSKWKSFFYCEQFSLPLHALTFDIAEKSECMAHEKNWNLRYWPSLMLFYGFMSQFSAIYSFAECHSVWINCIIINTRGHAVVIASCLLCGTFLCNSNFCISFTQKSPLLLISFSFLIFHLQKFPFFSLLKCTLCCCCGM